MLPAPGIYCPYLPSTYLLVLCLSFYRRMLEEQASLINIDCMDPLGKDLVSDPRILASSLKNCPRNGVPRCLSFCPCAQAGPRC